jgi:hypothetical protein
MIGSLVAILLASAQPAPAEEPVVTDGEAEVQADIQADVALEAPAPAAEVQATTAAEAEADADADATAAAEPEERVVCRRRLLPSERIGQRHRVVRDCRPASEWAASSRRRTRGGD